MRAAIVEQPGALTVGDIPQPVPGDYQVLCRMLYGATCTGTDQHVIYGRLPWSITYPTVLGHESIGQVVELGPKVRHLKVGDMLTRVGAPAPGNGLSATWGGFVEYGIAGDSRAMKEDGLPDGQIASCRLNLVVPPDIDPRVATMFVTWRETLSFITRLGVGRGDRLLVLGSGGTGLSFVAHARNLGAAAIAVSGNQAREATARRLGADAYCDYAADDLTASLTAACPEGFDFIIDAVGKVGMVDAAMPALTPGGTVAIYGIDEKNELTIDPRRARGDFTFSNVHYDEAEVHDKVIAQVRAGELDAADWVDLERPYELDEIVAAFDAVRERRLVKAVVRLAGP